MRRLNIVTMAIVPKPIYRLNTIAVTILDAYFADFDRLILKFIWKGKGFRIVKTILNKKKE